MTRRQFATAVAGLAAGGASRRRYVVLEAIVAPRIPQFLVVAARHGGIRAEALFELRTYESPGSARFDDILGRAGIRPILSSVAGGKARYLIPFDSLAARHCAWAAVNADPEWKGMQAEAGRVSSVEIYRRYPGGKILEMSL